MNEDWKKYLDLPSVEHRRQISRFCGIPFNDEEDIRLQYYVAFRRWLHATTKHRLDKRRDKHE
jgi:hypothetical protein